MRTSLPRISLCIPTYNGSAYLSQAIESVLAQKFTDFELLVVDDCSSDNTLEIVGSYSCRDPRIRFVRNDKNLGLVGNWNRCIELAQGEWIKFLFQDDLLEPECLEKLWHLTPGQNWVIANRRYIFEEGVTQKDMRDYKRIEDELSFSAFFPDMNFIAPKKFSTVTASYPSTNIWGEPTSVMIKKSAFAEIGMFDSSFRQSCDYEMWLRLGTTYGVAVCHEKLIKFRVHRQSTTMSNHEDKAFYVHFMDYFNLVDKLKHHPTFASFRASTPSYHPIIEIEVEKHLLNLRRWQKENTNFEAVAVATYPFLSHYTENTFQKMVKEILKCLLYNPSYIFGSVINKLKRAFN